MKKILSLLLALLLTSCSYLLFTVPDSAQKVREGRTSTYRMELYEQKSSANCKRQILRLDRASTTSGFNEDPIQFARLTDERCDGTWDRIVYSDELGFHQVPKQDIPEFMANRQQLQFQVNTFMYHESNRSR